MANLRGTARAAKRASRKWVRGPDYTPPPCGNKADGCQNAGEKIPILKIWGKHDEKRTKRQVIVALPIVLCSKCATTDPSQYVPDEDTIQYLREQLGTVTVMVEGERRGVQEEPDLERMVVQFVGNRRVRVERAYELANKGDPDEGVEPLTGTFERYYDAEDGVVKTRRVAGPRNAQV